MNILVRNLERILPKDSKKVLGRWQIDYCDKKISKKVDYSNEDHCGPCGKTVIDKKEDKIMKSK